MAGCCNQLLRLPALVIHTVLGSFRVGKWRKFVRQISQSNGGLRVCMCDEAVVLGRGLALDSQAPSCDGAITSDLQISAVKSIKLYCGSGLSKTSLPRVLSAFVMRSTARVAKPAWGVGVVPRRGSRSRRR